MLTLRRQRTWCRESRGASCQLRRCQIHHPVDTPHGLGSRCIFSDSCCCPAGSAHGARNRVGPAAGSEAAVEALRALVAVLRLTLGDAHAQGLSVPVQRTSGDESSIESGHPSANAQCTASSHHSRIAALGSTAMHSGASTRAARRRGWLTRAF